MKNLAVAFMGALVLAGCGSVRYPTSYVLNFPPPVPQAAQSNGVLGPVAIREFRCPEYLCEGRIVYRPSPEEVAFYEYHRWAMDPRQAITQYMQDGLRAQSLFQSVTVHERGSETAYVLSGNIERFEEVDQGKDVRAICRISAQLLDTRTRSVVWSRTETETVLVEKRDIAGVVGSLSAAARTVADRLLESMTDELPATISRTGPAIRPAATSPRTVPIYRR
jgi:cholesterol transport system auxiliary component